MTRALLLALLLTGTAWAYQNHVQFTLQGGWIHIQSNGIPDHPTGRFPNAGNPNTIRPQHHQYRLPREPRYGERITWMRGPVGVAVNGVPFDPGTAEFWRGDRRWNYEALDGAVDLGVDQNNAHVQPTGAYHYHGMPVGLLVTLGGARRMVLMGYAADGFGIYNHLDADGRQPKPGYRLKQGHRPDGPAGRHDGTFSNDWEYAGGDLDAVNGHFAPTPEHPEGAYHYHVTYEYPYVQRGCRGVPDPSFMRRPGFGPPGRNRNR